MTLRKSLYKRNPIPHDQSMRRVFASRRKRYKMSSQSRNHQLTDEQAEQIWEELERWGGDTLFQKIKNATCRVHTVVACKGCGIGVRPRETVYDLCQTCASGRIEYLTKRIDVVVESMRYIRRHAHNSGLVIQECDKFFVMNNENALDFTTTVSNGSHDDPS